MPQLHSGLMGGIRYQITNSVRLRAAASAYFSKTWGTNPTSRTTITFSTWVKRSSPGTENAVFGTASNYELCRFNSDDTLRVTGPYMAAQQGIYVTTQAFRDPSAWIHLVVVYDTSNATAGDRVRIYINGVRITSFSTSTASNINNTTTEWLVNAAGNKLGFVAANYFDGYFSDTYVIDGQALTPSSFGQTDSNGVWVPKAYTGTYGNNGFHLDFKDANLTAGSNVGLGKDVSGNGNYWNTNNISVTAGVTYDSMVDTPTNNYATLNPIVASAANISYAALRSGTTAVQGTMEAAVFAGAYWEVTAAGSAVTAGVISGTGTTNTTTVTANKVFGFRLTGAGALDYINITDVGSWTGITTGLTAQQFPYGITQAADWNFGQRPFIGTASGKALCTANLQPPAAPTASGTFTGNLNADGPFVWIGGVPSTLTINSNAVTFGTHADKTAGGFKLRTASASYNNTGSNTWSATFASPSTNSAFAHPQPAQGNP